MNVEVIPMELVLKYRHGHKDYEVRQKYDQSRVFVDGVQVGLTISNPDDRYYKVLHPLSAGHPKEFLDSVVENSNGELIRSLASPIPMEEETEDEFEAQD
jgi:hypothetical protein